MAETAGLASLGNGGSIHSRLRQGTAPQHQLLDYGLRYLVGSELTADRYVKLLAAFFGFYVPLEECFEQCETGLERVALPLIRRASLLERDLRAFDSSPAHAPICDEMPRLITPNQCAGAIYVVEGACLGGQVIARALWERLGIGRDDGAAFFTGDGPGTGARWRQVLAWLEDEARRSPDRQGDEIVEGACLTFAALSAWLSAREVLDA